MPVTKTLFWGSLGALAWTHVGYPIAAGALARVRERRVAKDASAEPTVAVIVAAFNEEAVIERRLENLLALDYPADRLEIVVASDASSDRTNELVEAVAAREPRVRLLDCLRGGKVAAQDRAVRETASDVVAFSDANATWSPDALRRLVANLADPEVAYVCGRLRLEEATGSNREGLYWRYELWLREQESRLGSVTGGNGSIYALNRRDYVEVDPRWGHDLSLPYRMVQNGRRAVYEPSARALERPTPTNEAEYARKVRMFEHCWEITLRGSLLRRLPPGLPRVDPLPPRAALLQRPAPPRAARLERRAGRRRRAVRARALRAARPPRGVRGAGADRALLRLRHVGDRPGPLELSPAGRAGNLGRGRGHTVSMPTFRLGA